MSEQINGWLAQGGGGTLAGVAALVHGGLLGGVALLVVVLAVAVKMAGPELREWVTMIWARKDGKRAELPQNDPEPEPMADAA
jgi:hypothetical protein